MSTKATSKTARIVAALAVLVSCAIAGAGLGLLYVRLFVPRKAMGWDGLADVLGGLMVGVMVGAALATALIALASTRAQARTAVGLLLLGVAAWCALVLTAPERDSQPVVEREQPFQPLVMIKARVSLSEERLAALPPSERPFSFTEVEIFSAKPHLVRTGWGGRDDRCRETPTEKQMRTLIPLLESAARETGEFCRTAEPDDAPLAFYWNLGGDRSRQSLEAGCLDTEFQALQRLAAAIDDLSIELCGAGVDGRPAGDESHPST